MRERYSAWRKRSTSKAIMGKEKVEDRQEVKREHANALFGLSLPPQSIRDAERSEVLSGGRVR